MNQIVGDLRWEPIQASERLIRISRLRKRMNDANVGAIVLTPGSNMRYFLGLPWAETERLVCAVVTNDEIVFVCPKFEDSALIAGVSIEPSYCYYWEEHENPYQFLSGYFERNKLIDGSLDGNCSYQHAMGMFEYLGFTMSSAEPITAPLRSAKSKQELALMWVAMKITNIVHQKVFNWIEPGVKASEVKNKIDTLHREFGADNGSTFCAVQFGEATSHPHGVPGDQILGENDLILIDTGCAIDGYNSDITRTYALNKVDPKIEDIWNIEKSAQLAVMEFAKPGLECQALDYFVRDFLQNNGLCSEYCLPGLPHRLGHGIGLNVHEGPYLVRGETRKLSKRMCFSNEPMIVVPGEFGVRLEDHFYVTDDDVAWFTYPQNSIYKPYG